MHPTTSRQTLIACLWMAGAIVSFTSMAIAGRQISDAHDTFEIMLYRSLLGILIVLVVGTWAGTLHQINNDRLGLHVWRNLAHFTGQNLWFFALPLIPLAQLFALEFTTPIWVILLSPLVLRERITPVGAAAALLGFIGILLVARPGAAPLSLGLFSAAAAAVFFALTAMLTRKLTRDQSVTTIMIYLTVLQAIFGLIMAGWDGDIAGPTTRTLPWLALIGCAGLLAHFCLTTALKLAPATIVMPIDFVRLPLIAVVGMLFYGEPLSLLVFVGAGVIFGANYMNIRFGQAK